MLGRCGVEYFVEPEGFVLITHSATKVTWVAVWFQQSDLSDALVDLNCVVTFIKLFFALDQRSTPDDHPHALLTLLTLERLVLTDSAV